VKKGDSTKEELKAAKQTIAVNVVPIEISQPRLKPRKITKDEHNQETRKVLRKALTDAKLWGAREKRAKDKANEAAGKKVKPTADEAAED